MADFRAFAAVSKTLQTLLLDRMETSTPTVTIAPPDVGVSEEKRVNLYLFQATENGYLKNQEIPGQGHPSAYGHPPLSLDLHYLMTGYPADETNVDGDLNAQEILGDAMRVFHDFPVVTPDLRILRTGNVGDPILDTPLLEEFEQVKITLQPVTLDDFSKIWTSLPKGNFRRSVVYHVSTVQIESKRERVSPRPVAERRVFAVPFNRPQIHEVTPMLARVGEDLTLRGVNFSGSDVRVQMGRIHLHIAGHTDREIKVEIPDTTLPSGPAIPAEDQLHPGPQPLEVVIPTPGLPQTGFHSNVAVFVLVPQITGVAKSGTTVTVDGTRLFREGKPCYFMANDTVIELINPAAPPTPPPPPTP